MLENFKFLFFFLFISQNEFPFTWGHICNYRVPKISELVNGILIDELPPHFRQKREASSNLRIHFDYQNSLTSYPQSADIIKNILEPARSTLQELIIPKAPTNGILRVDRACLNATYRLSINGVKGCAIDCAYPTQCLNIDVPDKYLKMCARVDGNRNLFHSGSAGTGIENIDLVLLVTYTPCGGQTLAYAGSCFTESTLDRPILGAINLCSDKMQPNRNKKENIKTIIHEMIHALGFSVDKYAFYRYSNGTPIVPRNLFGWPILGVQPIHGFYNWNDKIIKAIIRNRESVYSNYTLPFYGFVLPNVLAAARKHFNCPSLEAVDIENYGSSGSALSHFDEYFLYNEIMTPQTNNGIDFLSNITLALLQDTGWYIVNYSSVGNLDYGYQKGCILPEKGCYTYMKHQTSNPINLDPFCNKIFSPGKSLGCSLFKKYFYICSLRRYLRVSVEYQYFTSLSGVNPIDVQYYTGSSAYNEYCPTYLVYTEPSFVCDNELNNNIPNLYNSVPSYFGPDSMCFINEMFINYPNKYYGASCQKYIMNEKPNNLTIIVGAQSFSCPSNLENIFQLADGTKALIRCPNDLRTIIPINQMSLKNKFKVSGRFIAFILLEIFYLL